MFSYIRYFSLISLVVVAIAALMVGTYFQKIAAEDLRNLVDRNNVGISEGFINNLWNNPRVNVFKANNVPVNQWRNYSNISKFETDVFRYFEGMPVVRLNIYAPDGKSIVSINQANKKESPIVLGEPYSNLLDTEPSLCQSLTEVIRHDNSTTCLIPKSVYDGPDGKPTEGALIRTMVPILSPNYVPNVLDGNLKNELKPEDVEAVIEIFTDVQQQWNRLWLFQIIGAGGIISVFLILISVLLLTSRKAENIIAKQHEVNLELTAQAATAEAENQQKSQFLANVSHELRTPLNAIIGFSEIIKDEHMGPIGNTHYIDYVRDIHSSGVHLLSLINDILDFSKAEAGKLDLDVSEVDVTKILKNSMRLVEPRAEQAQVRLVEDIPKDHFIFHTDAKKLKQIMLNLLSNAVKFTPAGGSVTVTAWKSATVDEVTIQVKDTGIGIAPKDISRAMSPFGQVDNALSRKYDGTGLGLPLTRKFVEIIGGTFNITSEVNVGTTITFSIPMNLQQPNSKAPAKPNVPAASPNSPNFRI